MTQFEKIYKIFGTLDEILNTYLGKNYITIENFNTIQNKAVHKLLIDSAIFIIILPLAVLFLIVKFPHIPKNFMNLIVIFTIFSFIIPFYKNYKNLFKVDNAYDKLFIGEKRIIFYNLNKRDPVLLLCFKELSHNIILTKQKRNSYNIVKIEFNYEEESYFIYTINYKLEELEKMLKKKKINYIIKIDKEPIKEKMRNKLKHEVS